MKKGIVAIAVLAICLSLVCPAFAAEDTFVPSIGYKDGPEINDAEMNGEEMERCLVVTSLKGATEKTTDISQESRDLLLQVYDKLLSGEEKLPLEEGYIIRELVDISWKQVGCVEEKHTHEDDLDKDGVTVTIELEMGIDANTDYLVFAYRDGEWGPVEVASYNGDGSVTCVFEHFCPVAFCVKTNTGNDPTGDISAQSLLIWFVLMTISMAGIVVMTANRRKHYR